MTRIEAILRDHEYFRSLLDTLESVLGMNADTRFVLREFSFTLLCRLREHMLREDGGSSGSSYSHGEAVYLFQQAVQQLTEAYSPESLDAAHELLGLAVSQLRHQMDAQDYQATAKFLHWENAPVLTHH